MKTRDTRLCLYALELLLDERLELLDVVRIVVLESDNLTQDVDVEYLLLGCLFLQNGSPRVRERVGKTPILPRNLFFLETYFSGCALRPSNRFMIVSIFE